MAYKAADQDEDTSPFDADAFYETLDGERRTRGLNWKEVAAEAKVSPSTLTRLGQGRRPGRRLLRPHGGLGRVRRRPVRDDPKGRTAGGFLTNLPTYLRSDPNLDEKGVQALETIIRAAYDQFRQ